MERERGEEGRRRRRRRRRRGTGRGMVDWKRKERKEGN